MEQEKDASNKNDDNKKIFEKNSKNIPSLKNIPKMPEKSDKDN